MRKISSESWLALNTSCNCEIFVSGLSTNYHLVNILMVIQSVSAFVTVRHFLEKKIGTLPSFGDVNLDQTFLIYVLVNVYDHLYLFLSLPLHCGSSINYLTKGQMILIEKVGIYDPSIYLRGWTLCKQ